MNVLISLVVVMASAWLFSFLARKAGMPVVIGLIASGLVLGSPYLRGLLLEPHVSLLFGLGDIGLLVLMFLAGLEVSWSMLYSEKRDSMFVASFAFAVPFLLGLSVFLLLGFSLLTSLVVGVCMSITAEATKARVLLEIGKLKTKVGSLMMGAGIIDDVLGMSLFLLFGLLFAGHVEFAEFGLVVLAVLLFFAGIVVHGFIGRYSVVIGYAEKLLLFLVVPFFFVAMGLHFSLQSVVLNPLLLLVIILVAVVGKISGSLLTRPFTGLKFRQLYLVGWGMNSRGAVELALAVAAYNAGFLDLPLYSSLVVMALVTTLVFPVFIKRMVKKNPRIMGG